MALTRAEEYFGDRRTPGKATAKFVEAEELAKLKYNGQIIQHEGKVGPLFKLEADAEGALNGKKTIDVAVPIDAIFVEDSDGIQTTQEPV